MPFQALSVGKPFYRHLESDGCQLNYWWEGEITVYGQWELLIAYNNFTVQEIKAIRNGLLEARAVLLKGVPFFCFRYVDKINRTPIFPWQELPFIPQYLELGRGYDWQQLLAIKLAELEQNPALRMTFAFIAVQRKGNLIVNLNYFTLSNHFCKEWIKILIAAKTYPLPYKVNGERAINNLYAEYGIGEIAPQCREFSFAGE